LLGTFEIESLFFFFEQVAGIIKIFAQMLGPKGGAALIVCGSRSRTAINIDEHTNTTLKHCA